MLLSLALLAATGPFAIDMYLPTFPAIANDLRTNAVPYTLSGFMMAMGVGQLFIGPLSDRLGRRTLLLSGTVLSVFASILCALAPTIAILIAGRILLGIGGGACIVIARSVIPDVTHGSEAARAFSIMMTIQGLAPVIAPVAGGLLATHGGWRGIFFALACINALQLVATVLFVPETLTPERRKQEPIATTVTRMFGLIKIPAFAAFTLSFAFGLGTLFSYISASPFVFQDQLGMSQLAYSLLFGVNSFGLVIGSGLNARLLRAHSPESLLLGASWVLVAASIVLVCCALVQPSIWTLAPTVFIVVTTLGFILGNSAALGQGAAAPRTGAGAALMGFAQFMVAGLVSPLTGVGSSPAVAMGVCALACACIVACGSWLGCRRSTA